MNINRVNTIKFNAITAKLPVGPGQQIPFRNSESVQNAESKQKNNASDIKFENGMDINSGASINATKTKGLKRIAQKIVNGVKDFIKLDTDFSSQISSYPDRAFEILI